MLFKNVVACLITISSPQIVSYDKTDAKNKPLKDSKVLDVQYGKDFRLLPAGPAVEIPDVVAEHPAVKKQLEIYINSGEIKEVSESNSTDSLTVSNSTDYSSMNRGELESLASVMQVEFTDKISDGDLIKALKAVESI